MSPTPHGKPAPFVDHRRSPRIEALGRLEAVWLSGTGSVEVYDVSAGGFSVVTDVAFAVNSTHRFAFGSGTTGPSFEVSARVRYSRQFSDPERNVQYLTGLSFSGLDARGRAAVDRLIDTLTSTLSFD